MRGSWLMVFAACTGGSNTPLTGDAAIDAPAVTPAALVITPQVHDFGSVDVACTAAPQIFTVTNTGVTATETLAVAIDTGAFETFNDSCVGTTLAGGAMCTFSVRTKTLNAGAITAKLAVSAGALAVSATLDATGLAADPMTASPTTIAFDSTAVGMVSAKKTITLTGNGACPNRGNISVILQGSGASNFAIETNTCTVLADGTTCSTSVVFAPQTSGSFSAMLGVSDGVQTVVIPLSGVAP